MKEKRKFVKCQSSKPLLNQTKLVARNILEKTDKENVKEIRKRRNVNAKENVEKKRRRKKKVRRVMMKVEKRAKMKAEVKVEKRAEKKVKKVKRKNKSLRK